MKRGLLIAVEGIDGSGSTTQAKFLCDYLKSVGREVHFTAEPSTGPIGEVIRSFLRQKNATSKMLPHILALSFAADRLHHYENEILPKLTQGIDVVTDRYLLSSLVYQGLELPQTWIKEINAYAPAADMTILIDAPELVAKQRRLSRGGVEEIFDESDLQIRIRDRYLRLAPSLRAIIVDGTGDAAIVKERVVESIRQNIRAK